MEKLELVAYSVFRVTRNGHFEPFYSLYWHFTKRFVYFSMISSGYLDQYGQTWTFWAILSRKVAFCNTFRSFSSISSGHPGPKTTTLTLFIRKQSNIGFQYNTLLFACLFKLLVKLYGKRLFRSHSCLQTYPSLWLTKWQRGMRNLKKLVERRVSSKEKSWRCNNMPWCCFFSISAKLCWEII